MGAIPGSFVPNLIPTGGLGGGATLTLETPTPAVDQTTKVFTVSHTPVFVIADGQAMSPGNGYSYAGGQITLDNPPQYYVISFYNA